ncbi:MAG TPA: O-antigen ligase family protein [Sandaracinaceae bacterium]
MRSERSAARSLRPSSGRRRRVRRAATWTAPVALGVCLVGSPQLLGGAYGWGIAIIAALAGFACLTAAWAARADGLKAPLDLPSAAMLACVAWTLLQALPLPRAITNALQPQAVELADAAARLTGATPPSWIPLSISPGSTRAEIVKGCALVAAFFAAWLLAVLGHRRRVAQLVGLSTLVMALVALSHLAAGADQVFGVYEQVHTNSAFLAPLLNVNHLSGFLAMGVPVCIGLALEEEERGARLGYLTAAAVVGATALLAPSRGGVAALVCGLIALGALGLAHRRGSGRRDVGTTFATIGATVAAIAGLGLYVGAERLYRDFEHGDLSKLDLSRKGLALALEHPWVGVGRGSFSAAFVAENAQDVRFTHPENLIVQWASEWGIWCACLLAGILGLAIVRAVGGAQSWNRLGAAAGIAAIAVHDLVDFAMEMAGVAVVAAALLAAVIAPRRSSRARPRRELRAWMAAAGIGTAALVAVAAIGWRLDAESTFRLQSELTERMRNGDREGFREALVRATRLHPAEPAFPLLGGAEATRHGDASAPAWLNRAMLLAPGWSSPHLETARFLARRGRATQAYLEIRAAEERRAGVGAQLAATILERRPETVGELVRIAGHDELGNDLLDRTVRHMPSRDPAAIEIDRVLAERGVTAARVRNARRALEDDPERALSLLEAVRDVRDVDVLLARAEALVALGQHAEALRALDRASELTDDPRRVLSVRARALTAAGDAEGMRRTMEEIRALSAGRAGPLAAAWVTQGRLEQSLGNPGAALAAFYEADRLDPGSEGLPHAASLAERTGDLGRAHRAYGELCRRTGPDSPACESEARLARRLAESPPPLPQPLGTP